MENQALVQDNKYRWISKIFYNVTDSPNEKINPYKDLSNFLEARVGDLNWGKDGRMRTEAKQNFVKNLTNILWLYDFTIPIEEIQMGLQNESQRMKDLIRHLCSIGRFPVR